MVAQPFLLCLSVTFSSKGRHALIIKMLKIFRFPILSKNLTKGHDVTVLYKQSIIVMHVTAVQKYKNKLYVQFSSEFKFTTKFLACQAL